MILTIDIGNSLTKWALWDGSVLAERFVSSTISLRDEASLESVLEDLARKGIVSVAACSVVPELKASLDRRLAQRLGVRPLWVNGESELGMPIDYRTRDTLGADRVAAAFGALRKYGAPAIVCDFGTATTIDLVTRGGSFAGGMIAPGIGMLCESLASRTAQLIEVSPRHPDHVIGIDTKSSIESGVFSAAVGTLETALDRIVDSTGEVYKVIATGGFAQLIAEASESIDVVDENLVLEGLRFAATR